MPQWLRICPLVLLLATYLPSFANTTTDWNGMALESLVRIKTPLLESERAMAMVQLAVYEAANAGSPTYKPSAMAVTAAPGASIDAAITEAAYQELLALEHTADPLLKTQRDAHLAAVTDASARTAGMAVGVAAAAAVIASREHDGADWSSTYNPGTGAGAYLPTSEQPMAGPLVFHMRPFVLASYADLLLPPPAPLDSEQMRRDLEETATLGAIHSSVRTAEQTEIGRFHRQPGIFNWNNIARQAAQQRNMGEVQTASLLAAVNMAIVDAHFSAWQAKYTYNLWRPVTAIHAGGGPLHRAPDPGWESLIPAPMIPEYPCAHCALGASAGIVLEGMAGTGPLQLTATSEGVVRHYTSFRQYAEEESISRIYAGVHLRWSNYAGEALGRQVGERVLAQRPVLLQATVSSPAPAQ